MSMTPPQRGPRHSRDPRRPRPFLPPAPPLRPARPQYEIPPWAALMRRARRAYSRVGAAMSLMLVLWFLLASLLQGALAALLRTPQISTGLALVVSEGALCCIALPLGYMVLRAEPMTPTRAFRLAPSTFLVYLLMAMPIVYGGNILGIALSAVLTQGRATNRLEQVVGGSDAVLNAVLLVCVAPFVEEWLFRKQIIGRLRRFGEKPAIVLSALMFGLFHLNLYQFFYAFGLGLLFGYVYTRTSRLGYTIGLHMIINLNGGVVAPWVLSRFVAAMPADLDADSAAALDPSRMGPLLGVMLYGLLIMGAAIAGLVLLIVRWKRREFYPAPEQLPRADAARIAFANPGVVVFLVVGVLGTLLMLVAS